MFVWKDKDKWKRGREWPIFSEKKRKMSDSLYLYDYGKKVLKFLPSVDQDSWAQESEWIFDRSKHHLGPILEKLIFSNNKYG